MRVMILALMLAAPGPVLAQDWQKLDDAAITAILTAHPLAYDDGSEQAFYADGRTLYTAGAGESWGKWWAEAGRYCSSWPPSDSKSCYDVEMAVPQVRFTADSGQQTLGHYRD